MRWRQQRGFTLIEMLAVIVIIGIILAAGLPAFMYISKAGGLSASTRQVANELALARQYAIAKRTNTRVVFPYSLSAGSANSMWYSSFAVLSSNRALTGTVAWQYIGKWEYLQIGSTFRSNITAIGALDNASQVQAGLLPTTNGALTTVNMAYIEFQPTGAATQAGTLTIQTGYMLNGVPYATMSNVSTVSVDNLVGHIKVDRP